MINLLNIDTFAAVANDRRFVIAVVISVLSGLMRGFSGFGSALVYIPLISSIYEPKIAVATLLLIDFVSGIPFAIQAIPRCRWREIAPITISAIFAIPFGTMILLYFDPTLIRWLVAAVAILMLFIIIAGWRYRDRPRLPITIFVGLISGLLGGAFQMDGPPVVIYWLSGVNVASVVRANLMMFIVLSGAAICVTYLFSGLLTLNVIALAILLGLPFVVSMKLGARLFHGASDQVYRRIAYVVIAASVIISLPIFDGLLH